MRALAKGFMESTALPQSSIRLGAPTVNTVKEAVEQRRKADREAVEEKYQKEQARMDLKRERELSRVELQHQKEDDFEEDKVTLARDIGAFLSRRSLSEKDGVKEFTLTQQEEVEAWIAAEEAREGLDGD